MQRKILTLKSATTKTCTFHSITMHLAQMALFNEKAEVERDLLAYQGQGLREVFEGALETTHEVLEKFENPFTMEQNAAQSGG